MEDIIMRVRHSKLLALIGAGILAVTTLVACGNSDATTAQLSVAESSAAESTVAASSEVASTETTAGLSGSISMVGSTSMEKLANALSEAFMEEYPDVTVTAEFVGSGAGLPRFMGIPGEQAKGVFSANEFLTRNNLMKAFKEGYDTPIARGKKVVVVGGGNVAMDAARTALRLGAEVHIVYRRSEAELPARVEEVHHAKEEGVIFDLLQNPTEILVDENGCVKGVRVIKMELGEPDESGRRRPVEIPGSEYEIEADTVIMSLGTSPNPLISSTTRGLDVNKRGCIICEDDGATSKEAVYAGGDAVTGAATVILAMGAGKAAAKGIHEYFQNK